MDSRKYLFAFIFTILIFGTSLLVSNYLSQKKIDEVKVTESKVAQDILASEAQFDILEETSCKNVTTSGFLSSELGPLGDKLTYAENQNYDQNEVDQLKQNYFVLEIKDYLLMKRVTEKCGNQPTFILYFYSNAEGCPDCDKMGAVLTTLRERFPNLRVYSFDYNFNFSPVKTMEQIYHVKDSLPALIINGNAYYGLKSVDDLMNTVPALSRLASSTAATSTSPF